MSTKNLSRTVIEGGRARRNKWDRRYSSKAERAKTREYVANLVKDPEYTEDACQPKRDAVGKDFADKLSPIYRWIRAQVGRKWDEVKSEVFETFDTRNLAGRHVVYDHLLRSVKEKEDYRYGYRFENEDGTTYFKNDFYVDDDGFLRERRKIKRYPKNQSPVYIDRITNWLGSRIVGKLGNKMFWYVSANRSSNGHADEWKCFWQSYSRFYSKGIASTGYPAYFFIYYKPIYNLERTNIIDYKPEWREVAHLNLRQYKEFTTDDYAFWNTVPAWCQKNCLSYDPNNPIPKTDKYGYPYNSRPIAIS